MDGPDIIIPSELMQTEKDICHMIATRDRIHNLIEMTSFQKQTHRPRKQTDNSQWKEQWAEWSDANFNTDTANRKGKSQFIAKGTYSALSNYVQGKKNQHHTLTRYNYGHM